MIAKISTIQQMYNFTRICDPTVAYNTFKWHILEREDVWKTVLVLIDICTDDEHV